MDGCCAEWWVVAVVACGGFSAGPVEGGAEDVDGVSLEAESYVGVHGGGDADVSVAEEFFDDDEFDALFEQQRRGRVADVVEPDAPEPGFVELRVEGAGEVGRFDRCAVRGGEHVAGLSSMPYVSPSAGVTMMPFRAGPRETGEVGQQEGVVTLGGDRPEPDPTVCRTPRGRSSALARVPPAFGR